MTRKSKQAGGNFPLTYHEQTKKFASSQYGTTAKRLAGHSQYQLGDCALSLTSLSATRESDKAPAALCTPSGYLYSEEAILEFLLKKTQELKEQQVAYERQKVDREAKSRETLDRKKRDEFEESQRMVRKRKTVDSRQAARDDLKRTSYWLAESQPDAVQEEVSRPPERPLSPHSQQPLRRKDVWPLDLKFDDKKLVCHVSGKSINTQPATAYWTDKKKPGYVVLTSVYDQLIKDNKVCPISGQKIRYTRVLQQSGTSFASSGQNVHVKKYRPTIT